MKFAAPEEISRSSRPPQTQPDLGQLGQRMLLMLLRFFDSLIPMKSYASQNDRKMAGVKAVAGIMPFPGEAEYTE